MNYNEFKLKLIKYKLFLEKKTKQDCALLGLDKHQVEKDLIQYVIFIEELELLLKRDRDLKISDYMTQLNLINKYLDVLEEKIQKKA